MHIFIVLLRRFRAVVPFLGFRTEIALIIIITLFRIISPWCDGLPRDCVFLSFIVFFSSFLVYFVCYFILFSVWCFLFYTSAGGSGTGVSARSKWRAQNFCIFCIYCMYKTSAAPQKMGEIFNDSVYEAARRWSLNWKTTHFVKCPHVLHQFVLMAYFSFGSPLSLGYIIISLRVQPENGSLWTRNKKRVLLFFNKFWRKWY